MNESSNKRAIIVGLFVFFGLLFLFIGILTIGNLHETFKRKVDVIAVFDDVSGLQIGNNIWFSGVKVGVVSDIEFSGINKVRVIFKVEDKALINIRKDAFVKISTDGLIGNKILVIYGGTMRSSAIVEGDTLRVEKTFTSDDMINTLQENNKNVLAITNDFKVISANLSQGNGTVGKLLTEDVIYTQLSAATLSLQNASGKAEQLLSSLTTFSEGLNKKGTLANQLTTDTVVFNSLKSSALNLRLMTDTATVFISNLKSAVSNRKTSVGVLLYDEESGERLKQTIKNLESGSLKLEEDLEAAQHSIFLRGYFKNKK
jgi:phospholipid/cholesterol/gamma-HCH transport system substrate-binding protein